MKKLIYYTHPYFLDCDLPLVKALKDTGIDVYLFIDISPNHLKSTLVNIENQKDYDEIFDYLGYNEFDKFKEYIDLSKLFFINRVSKVYSLSNLKLRLKFVSEIRKINPDIIHLSDFLDFYDCLLYSFKNIIIQTVHDPFPHVGENDLRKRIFRNIAFKILKRFVLLNNAQRDKFLAKYKIPLQNVSVNRLGTYDLIKSFKNNIEILNFRNYILFFGRICKYKGIDVLLEAIEIVHKKNPKVKLVIAGSGNFYFDISKYEKMTYVTFINRFISMEELYNLISNSKIVVCPYKEATQSGVIMTALTLNKPVIATNVGGLSEMFVDTIHGLIIEPNNVSQLVDSINLIYENETIYDQMVRNIKEYITSGPISWGTIARKYINFYN